MFFYGHEMLNIKKHEKLNENIVAIGSVLMFLIVGSIIFPVWTQE